MIRHIYLFFWLLDCVLVADNSKLPNLNRSWHSHGPPDVIPGSLWHMLNCTGGDAGGWGQHPVAHVLEEPVLPELLGKLWLAPQHILLLP